ncbi:hypothetical protein, partial [Bacillus toyonensis]
SLDFHQSSQQCCFLELQQSLFQDIFLYLPSIGLLSFYVLVKKWLVYKPIILSLYDRVLSTTYRIHKNYANFQEIVERITGYDIYQ